MKATNKKPAAKKAKAVEPAKAADEIFITSIENNIRDYDIEELELEGYIPIMDDFGDNLFFNHADDNQKLKTYVRRDSKGYREVVLEITSWLGSIGAVHYYAKLTDYSIHVTNIEDKENRTSVGGYGTKGIPKKYTDLKFEIWRPVTQKDVQHDIDYGREDYMIHQIGEKTRGFWTEKDAIDTGIALFRQMFKGKWKLRIDTYTGRKVKTVYADQK
jgi:hypothetical protein